MEPQSGPSSIIKLPKSVQGEIYQFLNRRELARMEQVNKKLSIGARQDYLWRYLSENTLELATTKHYNEKWKQYYLRQIMAGEHITKERFNYKMCAIRHFKEVVTIVESYNNFVFAADCKGNVGIFLINDEDLENDDDTLQVETLEFPEGVLYMKHQIKNGDQQLVLITNTGAVITYFIELEGPGEFRFMPLDNVLQIPVVSPSNLYVCPLNQQESLFFVSNYPLDGNDFMKDQTITIFDSMQNCIVHTQQLNLAEEQSNFNLTQTLQSMGNNINFYRNNPWQRVNPMVRQITIEEYKSERNKQTLAVYDGSRLIISLFNNHFAVVETKMGELERFLKKSNYSLVQHQEPANPNNAQLQQPLAVDIRLHKGVFVAYHLNCFKIYDFKSLQFVEGHDLGIGSSPVSQIILNPVYDSITLIRKLNTKLEMINLRLDIQNKRVIQPIARAESEETHQINDIDSTKFVIASATDEGGVKFRTIKDINNTYFINAGSKTVKTYKEHPYKKGVSMVKISPNKAIVILGNLIRVYSFDFVRKK